jgi:hypothetical protein
LDHNRPPKNLQLFGHSDLQIRASILT